MCLKEKQRFLFYLNSDHVRSDCSFTRCNGCLLMIIYVYENVVCFLYTEQYNIMLNNQLTSKLTRTRQINLLLPNNAICLDNIQYIMLVCVIGACICASVYICVCLCVCVGVYICTGECDV